METFFFILFVILIVAFKTCRNAIRKSITLIIDWMKGLVRVRYIKNQILEAQKLVDEMGDIITEHFVPAPCFQCYETNMVLDNVSSNGKSISYSCATCGKEMFAPALDKEAEKIARCWDKIQEIAEEIPDKFDSDEKVTFAIKFKTQEAIMPYDQTFRGTIPQEVKSEVWQRDGGKCVICGAKEQLLFDQTIPVKNGAGITAINIQIVCKTCAAQKNANS